MWTISIALVLTGVVLLTTYLYRTLRRPPGFPPGPPAVPIFGSFPFMNLSSREATPNFFVALSRLANMYGPVMSIAFGHRYIVILNDYASMKEAMLQKGLDFADRLPWHITKYENPYYPVVGILHGAYSDQWKLQRNAALRVLRNLGFGRSITECIITEETDIMLANINAQSAVAIDIQDHIHNAISNVIVRLLFGQRFEYNNEQFKEMRKIVDEIFRLFEHINQHDYFPCASLIPAYRRHIRMIQEVDAKYISLLQRLITEVPFNRETSQEPTNFVEGYRQERQRNPKMANLLYQILSDFIQAGLETTSTVLGWAVYFIIAHPEVQNKVQVELDQFIGRSRKPLLSDRESLPYVEATMLETLRLGRTAPITLSHTAVRDSSIGGFAIPKGTEVWGNLWHIVTDTNVWSKPDIFNPERFLGPGGKVVQSEHLIPFGIGRRACMGEQLAKQELFLVFTHLLHAFHIRMADGEKLPNPVGRMGITHQPPKFNVNITCRK